MAHYVSGYGYGVDTLFFLDEIKTTLMFIYTLCLGLDSFCLSVRSI
jgi:hypothetical protein